MARYKIVTYTERFHAALTALCIREPSAELSRQWLDDGADEAAHEELQSFACDNARLAWAQGIGMLEAARSLADACEEGRPEMLTYGQERLLRHLKSNGPQKVSRRASGLALAAAVPYVQNGDVAAMIEYGFASLPDGKTLELNQDYASFI